MPGDIDTALPGETDRITETVVKINRLTTWALFYAGIFVSIYLLDWLSGLQATDGVFELSLDVELMPFVAFLLLGVLFYIGLETSLIVENDDVGWPTVRRVYRKVVQ